MQGLAADCRHALRLCTKTPAASLIAVAVLAIGMAFVGAFLSLYVDLALRPHRGFEQANQLASIGENDGDYFFGAPFAVVERLADEMSSIEAAATWVGASVLLGPERETVLVGTLSREFFSGLRPRLAFGRGFQTADHAPDAAPVAVLSYDYWQQRFGGDQSILGAAIEITRDPSQPYLGPPGSFLGQNTVEPEEPGAQFEIVGVMAEALQGYAGSTGIFYEPPIWVPLERAYPMFVGMPENLRTARGPATIVRRAPGASTAAVVNELRARYGGADSSWTLLPGRRHDAIDGIVGNVNVQRDARRQLEMFLAGSVLLALVAATNVSLYLLARAPGRRRELGVRMAIGAPVNRLARQLATEAGLLVVVAAVLGLFGSIWFSFYIRGLALLRDAEWRDVTLLDWRVLGLAAAVVLALTSLVSLAPILGLKRQGIAASSRQATARASLAQRVAGTAQIAVAGTLGGAAIAFGWHIAGLTFGDPGYEIRDRYVVVFDRLISAPPPSDDFDFSEQAIRERNLLENARRHDVIEAIPGVRAVAYGEPVPGYERFIPIPAEVADPNNPAEQIAVYTGSIEREFIDVLGLRIVRGRAPELFERDVVLVNQTLARALWGRDDVIGERVPGSRRWNSDGAEIIGVLEDLSFEHPAAAVKPRVFTTSGGLNAVVDSQLSAAGLRQALDRIIADGVIDAIVSTIEPLEGLRNELLAPDRARGFLTLATAILVVLLTAFGFYGTQRFLVAAGRREYAIRASLGAGPRALGRLVLWRGLLLGLPGLAVGGLLAYIVVAWLRDGFVSRDVSPIAVTLWVVIGMTSLLLFASLVPAREAMRTEPAPLLREE